MSKRIVLIVEDEPLLRMDAVDFMEEAGFDTLEANGADEAMRIMNSRDDIDAVFTDVEMPGSMNGIALAHAVRDGWPPVGILVVSGRVCPEKGDLPANVGFLRKPYRSCDVVSALRKAAWPLEMAVRVSA
jgi:CheY-like chemotaxis protein